ncbi:MAG: hypothetical protein BGO43_00515 [Gammaproteobacteria bacterium 39-13]|nr:FAD-dependent oxidoreductase [Gammaproteobacteria bacterium]OJV96740.1 MAG: hypothetical protein BGO43_00515 [Gammaproteobacteria bacterium 39-13]
MGHYPEQKLVVVGAGIIGAIEAYFAYLDAKNQGKPIRITIYDKNHDISETTVANIVPSLTPDEIFAVSAQDPSLLNYLSQLLDSPSNISLVARSFAEQAKAYQEYDTKPEQRVLALLELGKISMELWQQLFEAADPELKEIFIRANFNPCREPQTTKRMLHDGYRIDLIYDIPNAYQHASRLKRAYDNLGYKNCSILSPEEVCEIDPSLRAFCEQHTTQSTSKAMWNNNAIAIYRPGGSLNTGLFLKEFYAYLEKVMGEYINERGEHKNCFRLKHQRKVEAVVYDTIDDTYIQGLIFEHKTKLNKPQYKQHDYVFCPGEAVGTLNQLGFEEPAYSGFAGVSLRLRFSLPPDMIEKYRNLNNYMEVHRDKTVLAWQARCLEGKEIFIGIGGTKTYQAEKMAQKDASFVIDSNLLQLNVINDIFPEIISLMLKRDTKGQQLTALDLATLEKKGLATRWVGNRAVAFDGFPTIGALFNKQKKKILNGRCTTHLGSGGVSFSPAAVTFSRKALHPHEMLNHFEKEILHRTDSRRKMPQKARL